MRRYHETFRLWEYLLFAVVTLAVLCLCVCIGSVRVPLGDTLDAHVHGGVDENAQMVGIVRQRVVRAASDHDAGALRGDVADGIEGRQVHLLLQGIPGAGAGQGEHIRVHGNGVQQALGPLIKVLEDLFAQAALFRRLLQKLLIIKRNTQLLGHADTHFLAAAAELTSNGNDGLHRDHSSLW